LVGKSFEDIPDEVWAIAEPLIPHRPRGPEGGRPRRDNRRVLAGIVYRLRTGCQWKAVPRAFGAGSTLHRRFAEWTREGFFLAFFSRVVQLYEKQHGVDLQWASLDASMVKAPKGGIAPVPTPPIERNPGSNGTS
jgi:transposase